MILSIAQDMHRNFMMRLALTGGALPDLNPIENLWHELKDHLRGVVKPKTKQELIDGILVFWETVDEHKCQKYTGHL